MIGDKLIIGEHHSKVANDIYSTISKELKSIIQSGNKVAISVAGESGSGKSETAHEIAVALNADGIEAKILAQDDYFVFPPKTNHQMRLKNIEQIGTYEVKCDLIEANIFAFKNGSDQIYKPLIDYDKDSIGHEIMNVSKTSVLIIEGTYTTSLNYLDKRIVIDRTYHDTMADRIKRGREKFDPFIENVLEREHKIISAMHELADILIKKDFSGIISKRDI